MGGARLAATVASASGATWVRVAGCREGASGTGEGPNSAGCVAAEAGVPNRPWRTGAVEGSGSPAAEPGSAPGDTVGGARLAATVASGATWVRVAGCSGCASGTGKSPNGAGCVAVKPGVQNTPWRTGAVDGSGSASCFEVAEPGSAPGDTVGGARLAATVASASGATWVRVAGCREGASGTGEGPNGAGCVAAEAGVPNRPWRTGAVEGSGSPAAEPGSAPGDTVGGARLAATVVAAAVASRTPCVTVAGCTGCATGTVEEVGTARLGATRAGTV